MSWEAVIGLEIHVQLKTRTKMFCRCANEWGAEPNTRTCPVCLAHPGALPVLNRQAVEWAIRLGLALGCEIATHSIFHRKNYFYFDNPKAYQISQYDSPLCVGGSFVVPGPDGDREIGIVRAHLEEDAAKTVHVGGTGGRIHGAGSSLVDFNRGGTPLVEIVAEPDIRSPEEARRFLQLLRQTIVELGISDAEMDKGSLRCDANVSVREAGEDGYRTKTELKNMNSFKFVADGIAAEVARQIEVYESGGKVDQETLHFDPASGSITSLRSKEEAHDYRYFPEPDLVPLEPPGGDGRRRPRRGERDSRRAHPPLRVRVRALVLRRRRAERLGRAGRALRARRRRGRGREGRRERAHEPVRRGRRRSRHAGSGRAREARRGARVDSAGRVRGGHRGERGGRTSRPTATSAETAISDASELDPLIDEILAANDGQVAAYKRRQGGPARLLRRPGHAEDRAARRTRRS